MGGETPVKCFTCDGVGHRAENCPTRKREETAGRLREALKTAAAGRGKGVKAPFAARFGTARGVAMSMPRVHMTEGATCKICDKQNHTEAQCWAKHPELRPKNYNPGGAPDAKRPRQGLAMAVPEPPRRRAAEFEDRVGRGDEEFFSPGYPRQMVAMGVAEEGDVNGVEPGFYVGEMWVSMDVPVVHVRPPF